jgi:hypothetical protein
MTTFVALYRGQTVGEARLIAVSADPVLVSEVSTKLINAAEEPTDDPIFQSAHDGRIKTLHLVKKEADRL